jgi:hypothetical protein
MHELEVRWRRLNKEENRNEMSFVATFCSYRREGQIRILISLDCHRIANAPCVLISFE